MTAGLRSAPDASGADLPGPPSESWLGPGGSIVAARVLDAGVRFLLFLATARVLAPGDFSRYALLTAALATCQWTLSLGGPRVAMFFAARGEKRPLFAWLYISAAAVSAAVLAAVALSAALRHSAFPAVPAGWVLLGLAPLPFSLVADALAGTLLAAGRTRAYGATLFLRNAGTAVVLGVAVLVAAGGEGAAGETGVRLAVVLWGRLAVQAAVAVSTALLARARPGGRGLALFARRALAYAAPTAVSDAALAFHRRADVLLLSAFRREAEIGGYALAYAFAEAFWLVTDSLEAALFVDFARGPAGARRRALRAIGVYAALGAAVVPVGILAGPPLLARLFGARYPSAAALFPWLLAGAVAWGVSRPFFAYLSSTGRAAVLAACNLAGLAANVALNLFWIPGRGAGGAARACLASYAFEAALLAAVFLFSGDERAGRAPGSESV